MAIFNFYLRCQECREVFDDIEIARAHMDEELDQSSGFITDHEGFDILTEEEAF